ncbi:zinc-binding dehydrogenase [Oceanicola sp. 22II-s10i]|uniref:MDR family NADP-dependent oxidoreductase n=1 Tax=Oceanicola sp. 22II-s10i TaxID=1317116 RepID=UPI000B706515|nr:NADP-dependent oxidoreductase [Oceanicola sp. 22II-s10i]OWU85632.1 zinc-binding dehydrogenase [Oceanicola sp. 22II-s10i]
MSVNRQWILSDAPVERMPVPENFVLNEAPVPVPGPGQALVRTVYISLDPYQWGYKVRGLEKPGDLIHARTVVKVIESNTDAFKVGDFVHCTNGWQEYGLIGEGIPDHPYMKTRVIDPALGPVSTALGVLGMNGLTAYAGLFVQCRPQPGETVVVSAATGGVGQIVGQIARVHGCRAVGIVSTEEKMRVAREEFGYDAVVSHLSDTLDADLEAVCPEGVDVYYENVGGKSFDATARLFNQKARMVICGLIGERPGGSSAKGKEALLARSADLRAAREVEVAELSVGNFVDSHFDEFLERMSEWYRAGKVVYREDIRPGIERAPEYYADMMAGGNLGKTLVKVSDE